MARASDTINNLINGVSQQPYALRLPSQAEAQVNCYSHVVDGLTKAPATTHIKKLSSVPYGKPYIHQIDRSLNEQYKVILLNGDIKIFDMAGVPRTVNNPDGVGYLSSSNPRQDFTAITVEDYTFIVNKTKVVQMGASLSPSRPPEALLFVKATGYSVDFTVTVNGTPYTYSAGSTTTVQSTSAAATGLAAQLQTSLGAGWAITTVGSVIHLKKVDNSDFTITSKDNQADTYLKLIKNRTEFLSNLPKKAPTGFIVEIAGDVETDKDNYFLKFSPNDPTATFSDGVWEETVKPNTPWEIDASTMPHALIREADGSFTFRQIAWGKRNCGDTITNTDRSFIGNTINDVFFHRDRLSFLSDENVVCSRASEYFEFFRTTVTVKVDNDPIDKPATDKQTSILRHAVPFDKSLILFADNAQFYLQSPDKFSNETALIEPLTRYVSNMQVKPCNTGKTVLFATTRGEYTGILEFFVQNETLATDSADVTGHVPQYIPANIFKLIASTTENVALALSETTPNRVYVYKYYWNNGEKVQSAWFTFDFPSSTTVLDAEFIGSKCYFVMDHGGQVFLETMRFDVGRAELGSRFEYSLHRKVREDGCVVTYSSSNDRTTVKLPYIPQVKPRIVTRYTSGAETSDKKAGIIVTILEWLGGDSFDLRGDYRNTKFIVGQPYEAKYLFSRQLKKTRSLTGQYVITPCRLQLIRWTLTFADSGYFNLIVKHARGITRKKTFTGKLLGSTRAVIGDVPLDSGTYSIGVKGRSDKVDISIESDSHLPFKIIAAEWTGIASDKGRTP